MAILLPNSVYITSWIYKVWKHDLKHLVTLKRIPQTIICHGKSVLSCHVKWLKSHPAFTTDCLFVFFFFALWFKISDQRTILNKSPFLSHLDRSGPRICRFLLDTAPSNCWDGNREREEDIEEYTNDEIQGQGT